jgi:tetratricopeptide (TPR) repeat protein
MAHPVFISYARKASRPHAEDLHKALGARTAFLDSDAIEIGDRFPETLVDALLGARVVVIFAEPVYFTRWYCLLEFRMARTPFLRVAGRPGATAREKEDALRGLVVAMPDGADPMLERFPALVSGRNWPNVGEIDRIARLVRAELKAKPPTLRERYEALGIADEARATLLESTRLPPPLRIGNIPFVPQVGLPTSIRDAFVGRADDLWRIHDLLWTERGDPATAAGLTGAIEAIGGFGKTRLALEYLYRYGPRYFRGGLFWINAESDPELQLYDVLQSLNPHAPAIEAIRHTPGGVSAAVARAIRMRPDDAPTPLFIIDNVPEPQLNERPKPLETWCPVLGEVPVLTTSRTRVALEAAGSVVSLPVETLDLAPAVDLLMTGAPREQLAAADWAEIAEWVGRLPLALEVLNRLLRFEEITPRALLDLSRRQGPSTAVDKAMASIRNVVPEGALRGVTEAFSASYNRLSREEQYAARLIAWMAPAPIPTFVIGLFGPHIFGDGIRSKLLSRSFVTEVREHAGRFYGTMHRVLADFVRASSPTSGTEVSAVSRVLDAIMEHAQGRGTFGSALVRACAPLVSSVFTNLHGLSPSEEAFLQALEFASDAGASLADWGHAGLASDLFVSLATASLQRLGEEHAETLATLNTLAQLRREVGDYDGSLRLQERVLEICRRKLGKQNEETLRSMHNLAVTRNELGDYEGAQELQECVLTVYRQTWGDEHTLTLAAMSNLAYTRVMRGDLEGARQMQERVLEGKRRVLGDEDPATLAEMANLASTRSDLGDHAAAQALLEHVVESFRRILGDEHPNTLVAKLSLANTLSDRAEHKAARALQERVVEAMGRVLGNEHPTTLGAKLNLSNSLKNLGDFAGARELQERTLEVMKHVLGDAHPLSIHMMNNLAATRHAMFNYEEAEELLEYVLEARRRTLGEDHPDTWFTMTKLAWTRREMGNYAGAQALHELICGARRRVLGEEHPDTLAALDGLATSFCDAGNMVEAQKLQSRVLEKRRRILGDEHLDTLTSMYNLATTLGLRGEHAGARRLEERVLEARRRILGEDHPDTLSAIHNLASTLDNEGAHADARQLLERVLEARQRILGDEHPDTLATMNNLAVAQRAQGDHTGAQELQERVLEGRRRVLGEEHPATLKAVYNLALTRQDRGELAEALVLLSRAVEGLGRRLGHEHPVTTMGAWALHRAYFDRGDLNAADRVVRDYLLWLLNCDSMSPSLSEPQRKVQAKVRLFVESRANLIMDAGE